MFIQCALPHFPLMSDHKALSSKTFCPLRNIHPNNFLVSPQICGDSKRIEGGHLYYRIFGEVQERDNVRRQKGLLIYDQNALPFYGSSLFRELGRRKLSGGPTGLEVEQSHYRALCIYIAPMHSATSFLLFPKRETQKRSSNISPRANGLFSLRGKVIPPSG